MQRRSCISSSLEVGEEALLRKPPVDDTKCNALYEGFEDTQALALPRTGTQLAQMSSAGTQPWWKSWLTFSIFAFASSDLEGMYQSYLERTWNMWTLVHIGHMLMGWIVFIQKFTIMYSSVAHLVPVALYTGLLHPASALGLLILMLLAPAFYSKHRRAIYAAIMTSFVFTFRSARVMVLLLRFMRGKSFADSPTQQLHSFSVENFYCALIWLLVLAYPVGQIPDTVITTLYLLFDMSGNRFICGMLEGWGDSLVTMSPGLLRLAQAGSGWLSGVSHAHVVPHGSGAALSCPAAMGFWQLVGWWLACQIIYVADILRRRAFLRTQEAKAYLGRSLESSALTWPFGRSTMIQTVIFTALAITFYASIIWSIAVHALM
eukprot:jgi/Botrbrau1/8444/Bobra.0237s0063.1